MSDFAGAPVLPTDAEAIRLAKTLLRTSRYGALATLDPETGAPTATRVTIVTDIKGRLVTLVSALAAHTGALREDPRCSLLLGEAGKGDPLAHPRLTIACRAAEIGRDAPERAALRERHLRYQPKAKLYIDLGDFRHFVLEPQSASLNAGFGRAYAITPADLLSDGAVAEALAEREAGAVAHMNADHADAVALYARHFGGSRRAGEWRMLGLDPDGVDLELGEERLRAFFPAPLADAGEMRQVLVAMAQEARAELAVKSE